MDITEEILAQHHLQRRMFALLDEIDPGDATRLGPVWHRLATYLEVHAAAEELHFYPHLLRLGGGAPGDDGPAEETKDAIKDHNEIRDAIAAAAEHEPGTEAWWAAVRSARDANDEHMAEEEHDDLADFRRHADLRTRHELAVEFVVYEAVHADGVRAKDADPDAYVRQHGS